MRLTRRCFVPRSTTPFQTGAEPTYCMGDDVPLPVLASTPHMLYDYFKQRFAQASAPPASAWRCRAMLQSQLCGQANATCSFPHLLGMLCIVPQCAVSSP